MHIEEVSYCNIFSTLVKNNISKQLSWFRASDCNGLLLSEGRRFESRFGDLFCMHEFFYNFSTNFFQRIQMFYSFSPLNSRLIILDTSDQSICKILTPFFLRRTFMQLLLRRKIIVLYDNILQIHIDISNDKGEGKKKRRTLFSKV